MPNNILLCTDLDRTLIPNGNAPVSKSAYAIFSTLCESDTINLCYVTGRSYELTQFAITEFNLPIADFLICDVGASIFYRDNTTYCPDVSWSEEIESDWNGMNIHLIHELFYDIKELSIQNEPQQSSYKISYYCTLNPSKLIPELNSRLKKINVNTNIVISFDEQENVYLVDILPKSVSKLYAILYLMAQHGDTYDNTVFIGDSGNDIQVFVSGLPSVIVKNAHQSVLDKINSIEKSGIPINLYRAKGNFHHLNGNYVAGILEGVAHYQPTINAQITNIIKQS